MSEGQIPAEVPQAEASGGEDQWSGAIYTPVIEDSPVGAPISHAGDLVIAVRFPRSDSVTVVIGPNVTEFDRIVSPAPGIDEVSILALASTDEP